MVSIIGKTFEGLAVVSTPEMKAGSGFGSVMKMLIGKRISSANGIPEREALPSKGGIHYRDAIENGQAQAVKALWLRK